MDTADSGVAGATGGDMARDTAGTADLYETLGVGTDASGDEIARAYRRLARAHHPDANPAAQPGRFTGITDAYDVLNDVERRRAYDRTRQARAAASGDTSGTSIPVQAGGRHGRSHHPEVELELTFEQAALGAAVPVSLTGDERCGGCGGTGVDAEPCPACGGAGSNSRHSGTITIRHVCDECRGSGRREARCAQCHGTGRRSTSKALTVRMPPGVEDGAQVRVALPNGSGSLLATVRVKPHAYFGRRGRDLTLRLPITVAEAALGAVVTVPTLRDAVAVRVPAGTPPGRVLRVRGRGVPFSDGASDLLITVDVVIPTVLNGEQRVALEAFAAATGSPRAIFETDADVGGGPSARG